jgi:hypothetical protein
MEIKFLFTCLLIGAAACSGAPPPPAINPFLVFQDNSDPDVNHIYAMPCRPKTPTDFTVRCFESESVPVNKLFVGYFMISKEEIAEWRSWGKDIKDNYECKRK